MTRARLPRLSEVQAAARDPRLLRARTAKPHDPAWRSQSRCRTVDPETFFPLPTESADLALALCRQCDVQPECLAAALNAGDCEGVWGATTPTQRRAMLVAWRSRSVSARSPVPLPMPQPRPEHRPTVDQQPIPREPTPVLCQALHEQTPKTRGTDKNGAGYCIPCARERGTKGGAVTRAKFAEQRRLAS